MNKTWIVAKREFTSRVKKKTFLLSTILLPVLIVGFYAMMIYFSVKGNDDINIAVVDKANLFNNHLKSDGELQFTFRNNETEASIQEKVKQKEYTGYLYVPADIDRGTDSLQVMSQKTIGLITRERIEKRISTQLREQRLSSLPVSKAQLDSAQQDVHVRVASFEGEKKSGDRSGLSYAVGFISGFLIYFVLFIYGTMVMRGVMEEKVSRIAEVIVSSVRPFQLMMGKILGIGAVGLLQFVIWVVLMVVLTTLLAVLMPGVDPQTAAQQIPGGAGAMPQSGMAAFMSSLREINFTLLLSVFIFYFLGGYLLYSSLFAAVGSAVNEDPQDAQSLMLPVILPIIFAIVIMTKAVNDPTSGLAVFGSLFPLTSPVVMIARVAHGIPEGVTIWELLLSMVFLIIGFIGTTWAAGKIYRTGILLYGKKATWKEMWKWAFRKN